MALSAPPDKRICARVISRVIAWSDHPPGENGRGIKAVFFLLSHLSRTVACKIAVHKGVFLWAVFCRLVGSLFFQRHQGIGFGKRVFCAHLCGDAGGVDVW